MRLRSQSGALSLCDVPNLPPHLPFSPPVQTDERFSLALCNNLRKDGEPDEGVFDQSGAPSLHTRNISLHSYPPLMLLEQLFEG